MWSTKLLLLTFNDWNSILHWKSQYNWNDDRMIVCICWSIDDSSIRCSTVCVCACVLMFERDLDTVSVFRFLFMYVRTFSSILFESKTAYKRSYNVFDIFSTKFYTISFFHPSKINLKNWIMKTKVSTHLVRNCSNFPVSDSNGIDIHTKNAHTKVECIAHKFLSWSIQFQRNSSNFITTNE